MQLRASLIAGAILLALIAGAACSEASRLPQFRAQLAGDAPIFPRPPHAEHTLMCRWLVHEATWGVLSVNGAGGQPIGGVISIGDGDARTATGRVLAYLTEMDELAQRLAVDAAAALTVAEASLAQEGGCGGVDPEDPTCAKATLLGDVRRVPPEGVAEARALLFARHPAMASWPQGHRFALYEMQVREVHLLDYYGGMAVVKGDEYYAASLPSSSGGDDNDAVAAAAA